MKDDDSDDMDEYIRKVDKQIMKETKETKRDFKYYSKHINREMVFESESVVPQFIAIHHGGYYCLLCGTMSTNAIANCIAGAIANCIAGVLRGDDKNAPYRLYHYDMCCCYDEVHRVKG